MRLLPPSNNKNNKVEFDKTSKRQYLVNESSDFNGTKKFGIGTKNYAREHQRIEHPTKSPGAAITNDYERLSAIRNDYAAITNDYAPISRNLANGSSDFDGTKKFGIGVKNYTGQKGQYLEREDNGNKDEMSNVWESRLRPRTRPELPGKSREKHKGKVNPSKERSR